MMVALEDLEDKTAAISENVGQNIANNIMAAFNGGIYPERLKDTRFNTLVAISLGKAIGEAPFIILDELLDDDDF